MTIPSLKLTKTGSTIGGVAPQMVTYTYTLTNTSLTPVPIAAVQVADNLCAPLQLVGGDANGNGLLDNGESWTFTCTTPTSAAGCYTNIASATGTSTVDTRPVPANQASGRSASPRRRRRGHVKGATAKTSPKRLRVAGQHEPQGARQGAHHGARARRLNGKNIAKSLVKISGPAG